VLSTTVRPGKQVCGGSCGIFSSVSRYSKQRWSGFFALQHSIAPPGSCFAVRVTVASL
jgi:hypothetical protein